MISKNLLTVKEVAKLFGLSEATINHYINMSLIDVSLRKGNCRLFEHNFITHRMKLIQNLHKKGFLLRQIRDEMMLQKTRKHLSTSQ